MSVQEPAGSRTLMSSRVYDADISTDGKRHYQDLFGVEVVECLQLYFSHATCKSHGMLTVRLPLGLCLVLLPKCIEGSPSFF